MTYRAYIKKDYKPEVDWVSARPGGGSLRYAGLVTGALLLLAFGLRMIPPGHRSTQPAAPRNPPPLTTAGDAAPAAVDDEPPVATEFSRQWTRVEIRRGDNLSLLFDRIGLGPTVLYRVMAAGPETRILKQLRPGQRIRFDIVGGVLEALEFEPEPTDILRVDRDGTQFVATFEHRELDKHIARAAATIDSSLFVAGQKARLSDNLIMQLAAIYGWDIDFALDIRRGDRFGVIYEQYFKDGTLVREGPILAAEFVNNGKTYRAVRYRHESGHIDYYADSGASMRKAFLRTPLNFSRISSRFNLRRRHPVLNRIRAHRGVDYAAPTGTPVKATGDGTVIHIGSKGGYGRTVILRHGNTYSTLYAHLSRYARGLKRGKHVSQGQTIGYVGKSGLATGAHLHYEFRVNGVHRNPLTVALPKADSIPTSAMERFRTATAPLLHELERIPGGNDHLLALETRPGQPPAVD